MLLRNLSRRAVSHPTSRNPSVLVITPMNRFAFSIFTASAVLTAAVARPAQPAPEPPPERIAQLIAQLGDKDWKKRVAATEELQRLGKPALAQLEKALEHPDEEIRARIQFLITQIKGAQSDLTVAELLQRIAKGGQLKPEDLKSLKSACQQLLGNLPANSKSGTILLDAQGALTAIDNNGAMITSDAAGNISIMDAEGGIITAHASGKITEHNGIGAAAAKGKIAQIKNALGKRNATDIGGSVILDENGAMTVMLDNGAVILTDPDGDILTQNGLIPPNPLEAINQFFAQILGNIGEVKIGGAAPQAQMLVIQNGQIVQLGIAPANQGLILNGNALIQPLLGAGQPAPPAQRLPANLANIGQILNQLLGQAVEAIGAPQPPITPPAPTAAASSDLMDTLGARLGEAADGLRVTDIKPNSPAAKAGLQIGDLIAKVNGRDAATLEAVKDFLTNPDLDNPLRLEITRKDQSLLLTIPMK
jgi:hypothetical protein